MGEYRELTHPVSIKLTHLVSSYTWLVHQVNEYNELTHSLSIELTHLVSEYRGPAHQEN